MVKNQFQFDLITVVFLSAIVPLWCVCALLANPVPFRPAIGWPLALAVFAGIAVALHRLCKSYQYGWAIAGIAAPTLCIGVLLVVAVLNDVLR